MVLVLGSRDLDLVRDRPLTLHLTLALHGLADQPLGPRDVEMVVCGARDEELALGVIVHRTLLPCVEVQEDPWRAHAAPHRNPIEIHR